jgi:uncharacterized membrane protein YfcA
MNIKLKAFLYTVGVFVGITLGLKLFWLILDALPQDIAYHVPGVLFLGAVFYFVYSLFKTKFEFDRKL